MSIVLVIIGLLVGAVLTGQNLIHAAALRNQIKQLQEWQTAFNTFIVKYNCLPGDCANAQQFFGTTDPLGNPINNGNGNGSIDTLSGLDWTSGSDTWNNSPELWGAIQQLSLAHMINFTVTRGIASSFSVGASVPPLNMNTSVGLFLAASYNFQVHGRQPATTSYQSGSNALWLIDCNGISDLLSVWDNNCGIFTASDIQAIDQKIDDGLPLSGKLMGFGGNGHINGANIDCVSGTVSAATYKTSDTTIQCQAAYVIN